MELTWQVSSDDGSTWTEINAENDTLTFSSSESGSGSNLFTNGSLDGTVTNGKVPDSWTLISSSLSPDVNNLENPAVGSVFNSAVDVSNSNNGGTWVGFHDRSDYEQITYEEGFYQNNISLEAGKTYTISFEQANFGGTSNTTQYISDGKIKVFVEFGTNAPTVSYTHLTLPTNREV